MVWSDRKGGIAFWAWMVSFAVHFGVLGVIALVRYPDRRCAEGPAGMPSVSVDRIKALAAAEFAVPKPGIRRQTAAVISSRIEGGSTEVFYGSDVSDTVRVGPTDWAGLAERASSGRISEALKTQAFAGAVEFFGDRTDGRSICYVVDCSGSMQGVFERVRRNLKESITSLRPDNYFSVVMFGDGRIRQLSAELLRATAAAKSAACDLIDSVNAEGRTNALAGLKEGLAVRGPSGAGPATIYFLTDGFDLEAYSKDGFEASIQNLLAALSPGTRIHSMAFWPEEGDRRVLETIARQSGGRLVVVGGRDPKRRGGINAN